MTPDNLAAYKHKDLAQMAKNSGITGWHSMRKAQLVTALVKAAKVSGKVPGSNKSIISRKPANGANGTNGSGTKVSATSRKIQAVHSHRESMQDLSTAEVKIGRDRRVPKKDRIALMVRDCYWLQAYWELTDQSVQRAKAALSAKWHGAKPVLRVYQAKTGTMASSADHVFRTIEKDGSSTAAGKLTAPHPSPEVSRDCRL